MLQKNTEDVPSTSASASNATASSASSAVAPVQVQVPQQHPGAIPPQHAVDMSNQQRIRKAQAMSPGCICAGHGNGRHGPIPASGHAVLGDKPLAMRRCIHLLMLIEMLPQNSTGYEYGRRFAEHLYKS